MSRLDETIETDTGPDHSCGGDGLPGKRIRRAAGAGGRNCSLIRQTAEERYPTIRDRMEV